MEVNLRFSLKMHSVKTCVQFLDLACIVGKRKKKERNTPIYFNTNYRTEMKLVPVIMDYCLLQFDALKFFLGVCHVVCVGGGGGST